MAAKISSSLLSSHCSFSVLLFNFKFFSFSFLEGVSYIIRCTSIIYFVVSSLNNWAYAWLRISASRVL